MTFKGSSLIVVIILSVSLFLPTAVFAIDCAQLSSVDINHAPRTELECLVGIGPTYSERIIASRPFSVLDDLIKVSGIGPVTLQNIKQQGLAVIGSSEVVDDPPKEENDENGTDDEVKGKEEEEDKDTPPSTHSSPVEIVEKKPMHSISVYAGRERLGSVGNSIRFLAQTEGENLRGLNFNWAMGDGGSLNGKEISYSYEFPGEYNVVLTVKAQGGEEAVSRTTVRVIEPKLSLELVDEESVSIRNKSRGEINLHGWSISVLGQSFDFPQDTIISQDAVVRFPARVTGLLISGDAEVKLLGPVDKYSDVYFRKNSFVSVQEREQLQKKLSEAQESLLVLQSRVVQETRSPFVESVEISPTERVVAVVKETPVIEKEESFERLNDLSQISGFTTIYEIKPDPRSAFSAGFVIDLVRGLFSR